MDTTERLIKHLVNLFLEIIWEIDNKSIEIVVLGGKDSEQRIISIYWWLRDAFNKELQKEMSSGKYGHFASRNESRES